jgi:hypothetical protein
MVCISTIVYGTLGIIGALLSKNYLGLLFIIPYTFLIEWVCAKNWVASWFLIFLPPILIAIYVAVSLKK